MADTRNYNILGIWADGAVTVIPGSPVDGVVYRDPAVDQTEFEEGWPFNVLVNSADFNQKLFLMTSVLLELDQQGILGWNDDIDYGVSAMARGSDDVFYVSTAANGPATSVIDPVGDLSGTWVVFAASAASGNVAFDIDALPDGTAITLVAADRIAFSDQSDSQTDKFTDMTALQAYMQSNLAFGGAGYSIGTNFDGTGDTIALTDLMGWFDVDDLGNNDKFLDMQQLVDFVYANAPSGGGSLTFVGRQIITANQVYTATAGTNAVNVRITGGGGGGGNDGSAGSPGGTTSFGALSSAGGGTGGTSGGGGGGKGGTGSGGGNAVIMDGGDGVSAMSAGAASDRSEGGIGGSSHWGGGGHGDDGGNNGAQNGKAWGSGGGGAFASGNNRECQGGGAGCTVDDWYTAAFDGVSVVMGVGGAGNGGGGTGKNGICIVDEYA